MEKSKIEKIINLAKRRGFVFQSSDLYGGLSGFWDYGPLGLSLKNNIKNLWFKKFVLSRDDIYPIESAAITSAKVFEASGHLKEFADLLMECKKCRKRYRLDHLKHKICHNCKGKDFTEPRRFNLMFKTYVGPVEEEASVAYLRPENAQGMFVNFKNILDAYHPKIPFGIAQIAKVFRNEINPGDFLFRIREYELMEFEYFIREKEWEEQFDFWLEETHSFLESIGLKKSNLTDEEIPPEERAHYSKRTVDIYYDYPFGKSELCAVAYRGDYDLKNHSRESGVDLSYFDEEIKSRFIPHVIEPTFGADRLFLALLSEAYDEDEIAGEKRIVLRFKPGIAPLKIAVFPLLANKPGLVEKAKEVYRNLRAASCQRPAVSCQPFEANAITFDDIGNIGKRYRRQDEIGTPWCVTIDFETLKDDTVTVRDRDSTRQERLKVEELKVFFSDKLICKK
jgi:glycyl-tRNA synthetase